MKKRIIGLVVTIALIATSIFTYQQFNKESITVYAENFRDGYLIAPTKVDSAGVKSDSDFILKWEEDQEDFSITEVEKLLTISPETDFTLEEDEDGILIHPTGNLEVNTIYVLDFDGTTFAYKTEADFALIGTFPRNQTTNVPVKTGIEFVFNMEGANVEDYFEISPDVKGSFESHGRVVAFVPKELKEATVYTVTLKAGLELKGSDKVLKDDVSFSFETESTSSDNEVNEYVGFRQYMSEYRLDETPSILWDFYAYEDQAPKEAQISVYAYKDILDFVKDLNSFDVMPYWSRYGSHNLTIDTDNLKKVMSFDYEMMDDGTYPQTLTLPEQLKQGYYLVDVSWGESKAQTYIQVTDLGFYYTQGVNGELFWTHDLGSGEALADVNVHEYMIPEDKVSYTSKDIQTKDYSVRSNSEGIIDLIDNRMSESGKTKTYLLEKDGMQTVCFSMNTDFYRSYYGDNANYWKYFTTDRSLYKPSDQVEFFGFVKNRYEDETINKVSVEVTMGSYYYWDFLPYSVDQLSYVTEEVDVVNGFYSGHINLPGLSEGGYQVQVKSGDTVIATSYINVEDYVKPSYKIETSTDKKAVFAGQPVEITVNSEFFEGTPVSYLDFEYNIGGLEYTSGKEQTDKKGQYVLTYTPEYIMGNQGQHYYNFSSYAQLPESGSIWSQEEFRVFLNDIHLDGDAKIDNNVGTLSLDVHTITLDRINDDTAESSQDFLDEPVEGQVITGDIFRNEWIKTEVGEYYDFINKEVRKSYDYNLKTDKIQGFKILTDADGHGELKVDLPKEDKVYYTATVTTTDSNNRVIKDDYYFGDYGRYKPYWGDYYRVELNQDSYQVGDQVEAEILYGEESLEGDFLFLGAQNGIVEYKTSNKPAASFTFKEDFIPNVDINGVYFNGKTYVQAGSKQARFDFSTREIELDITTDKEGYRPGEEIQVNVAAYYTDVNGSRQPVTGGVVNLGLIDEALLALSDQIVNPLDELYAFVSNGIYQSYISHTGEGSNMLYGYGARTTDTASESGEAAPMDMAASVLVEKFTSNGIAVRSEFKDTALFTSFNLDQEGKGQVSVKLPDNVTSWRLTGAAISTELQAGSQVEAVPVSLPFFLNTSLSSTYLIGDSPYVGVTAYGSSLKGGETIDYTVNLYDMGGNLVSSDQMKGSVYERINLPLGRIDQAGKYEVEVKGMLADGNGDGLKLPIEVYKTYHEQLVTKYMDTQVGMTFDNINTGDVTLTFTDQGKAKYLRGLYRLAHSNGKRIDQKYLGYLTKEYLNKNFGQDYELSEVLINDYMVNGGLAILPYADADIETTVNMLGAIDDRISSVNLALYLQNAWYDENITEKGAILYGLAKLNESNLGDLNQYAQASNLSDKDKLYVGLAYAELGDDYMAKLMYMEVVKSKLVDHDNVAFVDAGSDDKDLEITAMAMVLAEHIDLDIHNKLYEYVLGKYSKEVLINTWLYDYATSGVMNSDQTAGSVTYTYNGQKEVLDFEHGYARTLKLPGQTLNLLSIDEVQGNLQVAVTIKEPMKGQTDQDTNLSVTRKYYNYQTDQEATTFKEGDIVKVVLEWSVGDDAIDDYYRLTDYAPAGLKPIDNPWQLGLRHEGKYMWYRDVEGQEVDFYIYKDKDHHQYEPLVYYARIASIGEFKAEAPVIQGTRIMDSLYIGDQDTLYIKGE